GVLPACDDQAALYKIASRLAQKEGWFWRSDLTIVAFDKIREVAFRPGPPNTIPRRFCTALAFVSDGFKHPIHYSIGEDTGMTGSNFGGEWGVLGLDRNRAYNPAFKKGRPYGAPAAPSRTEDPRFSQVGHGSRYPLFISILFL